MLASRFNVQNCDAELVVPDKLNVPESHVAVQDECAQFVLTTGDCANTVCRAVQDSMLFKVLQLLMLFLQMPLQMLMRRRMLLWSI